MSWRAALAGHAGPKVVIHRGYEQMIRRCGESDAGYLIVKRLGQRRTDANAEAKRQKARETSRLEDIPGIGPRRRASLLKHFGGLVGLKAAGEAEIAKVEGINDALAARIYANLHGLPTPPAAGE